MIRVLAAIVLLALPAARGAERSPQDGGPVAILDNATVNVVRRRLAAGAHETIRANGGPLLVVHPTRGPAFVENGGEYAALNDGSAPIDLLIVALKPNRLAAAAAPPTEAPPGITRTTLIDNADVRVVRVTFAPGSREPVHTHPNDLLTIQLTPGTSDILLGEDQSGASRPAGFVKFLPRNLRHAYISTDTILFDMLSISIK